MRRVDLPSLARARQLTARELAELGALPRGIAVGCAWRSSAGSYAAAPGVRLHPHHDLEVLTAIVRDR